MTPVFHPHIADAPASPRDASRLFIYDTATDRITFDRFFNLPKYLPKNSFLVMNQTKVVPARMWLKKATGGKVEALFLMNEWKTGAPIVKILVDRKVLPGQILRADSTHAFFVEKQDGKIFYLRPDFPASKLPALLKRRGITPIPRYIKNTKLTERDLRKKYQTVFAEHEGSVAAPTASLHFTNRVFKKLEAADIPHLFVTLHVGLGTFSPPSPENYTTKKLFAEWYEIPKTTAEKITQNRASAKKLVAVGTTTVRTLESWAATKKLSGSTDIFILPPYSFRLIDCLMTNFHLPDSSLVELCEAFLQYKKSRRNLRDLYTIAMKEKFRFYSFGDAMVVI